MQNRTPAQIVHLIPIHQLHEPGSAVFGVGSASDSADITDAVSYLLQSSGWSCCCDEYVLLISARSV